MPRKTASPTPPPSPATQSPQKRRRRKAPALKTRATPSRAPMVNYLHKPPNVVLPTLPTHVQASATEAQGYHPTADEEAFAAKALADLARFDDYASQLGLAAPARDQVTEALDIGLAWRDLRPDAEAWYLYVKMQDGLAWKRLSLLLGELRPIFRLAASKDASLATLYPSLARMLDAPYAVAKRSVETRKQRKRAKGAATEQATAPSLPTAPSPEPAPPKPQGTTVTINT